MDWSKAKTILIIALLITNVILGGFYANSYFADINSEKTSIENAREYLASRGVSVDCKVPVMAMKLPVIFVNFEVGANAKSMEFRGIPLVVLGETNANAVGCSSGSVGRRLGGASSAIIEACVYNPDIKSISSVNLVYMVDRTGYMTAGEDTAVPCWELTTDEGVFYYEAIVQ